METDNNNIIIHSETPSYPVSISLRGGEVEMLVLSTEQIEKLNSGNVGLNLALFTLVCGIAVTLIITLYTVKFEDPAMKAIFWAVFWAMVILTIFFGFGAIKDYRQNEKLKKTILNTGRTIKAATPEIVVKSD